MPKSPAAPLVKAALEKLAPPYSQNVISEVFKVIRATPHLEVEYQRLANEEYAGQQSLNQTVGRLVTKLTERAVLSGGHPTPEGSPANHYSKLRSLQQIGTRAAWPSATPATGPRPR